MNKVNMTDSRPQSVSIKHKQTHTEGHADIHRYNDCPSRHLSCITEADCLSDMQSRIHPFTLIRITIKQLDNKNIFKMSILLYMLPILLQLSHLNEGLSTMPCPILALIY